MARHARRRLPGLPTRLASLALAFICLVVAGCGFTPRGSYRLPAELQRMAVTSHDEFGELPRLVAQRLRRNDVEVVSLSAGPVAELNIQAEREAKRTLSVYEDGRVAEYELSYQVDYQVRLPDQPAQQFSVKLHRDFLDDPRQALAKSREQELLRTELRSNVAEQIIRQLATLSPPQP